MTVIFRAVDPGEITWAYIVQREWIAEKGIYNVVVEIRIEGEEADRIARNTLFDPFS